MQLTIELPDNLAAQLQKRRDDLPRIIEIGLRELNAAGASGFSSMAEALEILADLPDPKRILALRPSEDLQSRINELLEKNRTEGLSPEEEKEWAQYEWLEHLIRTAKARAALKQGVS